MSQVAWEQLVCAVSEQKQADYQQFVQKGGYSAFHHLLEGIKLQLRQVQDSEIEQMSKWIDEAQQLFPEPALFSPSWSQAWDELKQILSIKSGIMQQVPVNDRSGEWQIIIDNPLSNHEIVCHPGLSFDDAAYLYSYFRPGLEKNEYIRLQKVLSLLTEVGD